MARQPSRRKVQHGIEYLRKKGLQAVFIGAVLLIASLFLGATSSPLKTAATALRVPGWMALGIGLLLLGGHFIFKRRATPAMVPASTEPRPPYDTKAEGTAAEKQATKTPTVVTPKAPTQTWSPAVFSSIEWRRFEAVCETLFAQAGFQTRSQSHGADGGVDIWLHSTNAEGPVAVVQCKHWQGKAVGVKELREFYGVMASHKLQRGTYATTSAYTDDAAQFAKTNGINALDATALLALIAKRTPEQQQALLAVAYEGEYWRPTCASCGMKMLERIPSKGGAAFWGCSQYPRCKSRLPMQAARERGLP